MKKLIAVLPVGAYPACAMEKLIAVLPVGAYLTCAMEKLIAALHVGAYPACTMKKPIAVLLVGIDPSCAPEKLFPGVSGILLVGWNHCVSPGAFSFSRLLRSRFAANRRPARGH